MVGNIHQSIKVEQLAVDVRYAITLCPEVQFTDFSKKTNKHKYKDPHMTMAKYTKQYFSTLYNTRMLLHYELSPLGRQHYHGWFHIKDLLGFITKDIHQLMSFGALCIKPIDDLNQWIEYCKKQKFLFEDYSIFVSNDLIKIKNANDIVCDSPDSPDVLD